jgi:hypothetical protein
MQPWLAVTTGFSAGISFRWDTYGELRRGANRQNY